MFVFFFFLFALVGLVGVGGVGVVYLWLVVGCRMGCVSERLCCEVKDIFSDRQMLSSNIYQFVR